MGIQAPDSASTARKKDLFRQRRVDKSHTGRDEAGMGGIGVGMSGFAAQQVEHDLGTIRSEYDLLYPQPVQAIRGAGSGPGLVGGHRNTPTTRVRNCLVFLCTAWLCLLHFCMAGSCHIKDSLLILS